MAYPESTWSVPGTILFDLLWPQGPCVMEVTWHLHPRAPELCGATRKEGSTLRDQGLGALAAGHSLPPCLGSPLDCFGGIFSQLSSLPPRRERRMLSHLPTFVPSEGSPWEFVRNGSSGPPDLLNLPLEGWATGISPKSYAGF